MARGLRQIADECGLSPSTVSNILGSRGAYATATVERVLGTARRHGYTPSRLARSLIHRSSPSVAVLATDLTHPFYAELLEALTRGLAELDLHVMVGVVPWGDKAKVQKAYKDFLAWHPKAFLVIGFMDDVPALSDEEVAAVTRDTVMVAVNIPLWPTCPAVFPDRQGIARLAVEHLTGLGHRRIGVLSSPNRSQPRIVLLTEELRRRGVDLRDEDMILHHLPEFAGERAAEGWFDLGRQFAHRTDRPSALVARSEPVASWFLGGFLSEGGKVPDQLSVITHNNTRAAGLAPVPLTAVGVPTDTLAGAAVDVMSRALGARDRDEPYHEHRKLSPQLTIRRSTASPPEEE